MAKLKNKVSVLIILLIITFSGAAGALVYHINDAAEAAKLEYSKDINQYFEGKDEKIKHDVENLTSTEIERLRSETNKYLQEKLNTDYQNELNAKSNEIVNVTNKKIEEIKDFIDVLIKEKNKSNS
ncbi:hypothetical protein KIS4809_2329 [Bacillus sp. ZZV12-4809]|nr:hypothetical protein KIS4809_2329 [Bacillus sp. ZZV12-4809]